jgi:hypothetical protein
MIMKGFPKVIATKQDFINLLSDKNYKEEALEKLQTLQDHDDRVSTRTLEIADPEDPESEDKTERIETELPIHKQIGFEKWLDVVELNAKYSRGKSKTETRKQELLDEYSKEEIESTSDVVVLT